MKDHTNIIEDELIFLISARAEEDFDFDPTIVQISVTACHCNGNPLRLSELLKADDFNFIHDIAGIIENVSPFTGECENCFSPRHSAPMRHHRRVSLLSPIGVVAVNTKYDQGRKIRVCVRHELDSYCEIFDPADNQASDNAEEETLWQAEEWAEHEAARLDVAGFDIERVGFE